ncbi:hypothetical protein HQ587_08135 [bacterium]|nr:hypothetical protein [bacterium]
MRTGFFILLLSLLLISCDLFSTRAPENPDDTSASEWQFPSSPRIVVNNLEIAVGRRSIVDYMKSFSDASEAEMSFQFEADSETQLRYPGLFDNWGRENERSHVLALFSPDNLPLDSLVELTIVLDREPVVLGDSAEIYADYELHIGHKNETAPRQMQGQLDFGLKRADDGGWYLVFWRDVRIDGHDCWSDLKARF